MHKLIKLVQRETIKLTKSLKSVEAVQELKFYEIIHGMLTNNIKKTKREIFYSSPNIFKRQEIVNKMIDRFANSHRIKISDFNVSASLKGLFHGEITFVEKNREYTLFKNLIPDMNEVLEIKCKFDRVLVVEKDSMLTFIKEVFLRSESEIHFLLVTGKGYADYNTLAFLEKLEKLNCKIYGLFDFDPFGLNIFKNYRNRINTMNRIGITSKDVFSYKVKKNELITLTHRDYKMLNTLKKNFIDEEFKEDILFLEGLGKKMEIEIFTSYQTSFIIKYLKEKLSN